MSRTAIVLLGRANYPQVSKKKKKVPVNIVCISWLTQLIAIITFDYINQAITNTVEPRSNVATQANPAPTIFVRNVAPSVRFPRFVTTKTVSRFCGGKSGRFHEVYILHTREIGKCGLWNVNVYGGENVVNGVRWSEVQLDCFWGYLLFLKNGSAWPGT